MNQGGQRRLVVSEFLSLDGVMQAPGLPDEDFAGYWPKSKEEMARPLNAMTKYVVSRTRQSVDWQTPS